MASEKIDNKEKKKDKYEKKNKKEKLKEDGVKKSKSEKKEKKEKKEKEKRASSGVADAILEQLESAEDAILAPFTIDSGEDKMEVDEHITSIIPIGALVPFANPLADDKQTKRVLKTVKKAAKNKTLKRGVKEVVKSLRKSPTNGPSSGNTSDPIGVVIIAADISPMDVVSHIPVLCEDHNIPYIYVTSRAELGTAGNTKRATSVVLIMKDRTGKMKDTEAEEPEYKDAYADLVKMVRKASQSVLI